MSQTRRLAAILAADVAGYSRLMGQDEEGTLAALKAIRRELGDPKVKEHRGRIVKTTGDGLLVEFASVVDAVRCAVEVQQAMVKRNADVPEGRRIEFRMGINLGDVMIDDDDIYGDGVNIAARLETFADPGAVLVSNTVYEHVRDRLTFDFDDLGEQRVKNIARSVHVYRVYEAGDAKNAPAKARPAPPLPDKPSIAVLPFQNMTGNPDQDYFVDGIVEEITTAISRLPRLFVIARNSAFTYKGKAVDVKQVARELGVRYVLEGSVRKAGNRVRITGQLIDTETGAHIWADRFDGTLDDIFDLQDQVASSVAGAIEPRLRRAEIERATRKPTESLDAYDFYLRAVAQCHKRTEEGMAEAVRLAYRALERDPTYAPAMAIISNCREMQRHRHWIASAGPEIEEGIRMARQAIAGAEDNLDVSDNASYSLAVLTGEYEAALSAIDRAIRLNPNSAAAFGRRALVLVFLNRPEEAILSAQQAMRLSPLDPHASFLSSMALGHAHLAADRYEAALPWADQALRDNAGLPALRLKLALLGHLGRREEACDCLRRLREIHSDPTIAGLLRDLPKGFAPEIVVRLGEGLRKAGLPEK